MPRCQQCNHFATGMLQYLVPALLFICISGQRLAQDSVYTDQIHVRLRRDASEGDAKKIASGLGMSFVKAHHEKPTREFLFSHNEITPGETVPNYTHLARVEAHPHVESATQVEGFLRKKRGYNKKAAELRKKGVLHRQKVQLSQRKWPNDPLFEKEWYIRNTGQAGGRKDLDLNAYSAWSQNITGKGVTTAIMDDGIDYLHPDIAPNFNAECSYDFSSNDPFPFPRYTDDWFNSHGTRCAGEISAVRDNKLCGAGVAYNSRVAGLRMLDQPYMTDFIEAAAMSHKRDEIDIYSASWGPTDNGKTVDGPRNQTQRALVEGVNKGRKGLGNIFVWASGDGGKDDDCNCDGYAASMWTISINSATNDGQTATYDESCSSTLASTFSNGKAMSEPDAGVATTDLYGECTLHHSGTSAAAPEAAGVYALALEANPRLTWRDVQHVTVLTSKRRYLYDRDGHHNWTVNGAGLELNHLFGYGIMDAGDMVDLAKKWVTVPERFQCVAGVINKKRVFNITQALVMTIKTDACKGDPNHRVNYIEHVQAFITVKATRRGDINMFLTSPSGTTSMILSRRPKDDDRKNGFTHWPFMTSHAWGENPRGEWRLTVTFDTEDATSLGLFSEWQLVIHGTQEMPYEKIPDSLNNKIPKLGVVKRQHRKKSFNA